MASEMVWQNNASLPGCISSSRSAAILVLSIETMPLMNSSLAS